MCAPELVHRAHMSPSLPKLRRNAQHCSHQLGSVAGGRNVRTSWSTSPFFQSSARQVHGSAREHMTLRTSKTQRAYDRYRMHPRSRSCYLCRAVTIKAWRYWKLLDNEYPYDRIADTHHIIALKRHAREDELTPEEIREWREVRGYLHQHYDMLFENTVKKKSIPGHHHLHAITLRTESYEPQTTPRRSVPLAAPAR